MTGAVEDLASFLKPIEPVPEALSRPDGSPVRTAEQWRSARSQWLDLILDRVYGRPPAPQTPDASVPGRMKLPNLPGRLEMVRLALPEAPDLPITLSLGLADAPGPRPTVIFLQNLSQFQGVAAHPFTRLAFDAGFHLATFSTWDAQPDQPEGRGWRQRFPDHAWGALTCWAWAVGRVVDYLLTRDEVDPDGLVVTGHSRRGKTSLLAAAMDSRIAYCAPNASGLFGLDLTRGHYHPDCDRQQIPEVLDEFPHWFCPEAEAFRHDVWAMPFDQHHLLGLVAPRPLITTQACDDQYTWVPATRATLELARPIYELLGVEDGIIMHTRPGRHAHTAEEFAWVLEQVRRRHGHDTNKSQDQ